MIQDTARALLSRLDSVTPADGDEMSLLFKERGWVEALLHLADNGMLTTEGEAEAAKVLAASGEWAAGLQSDFVLPPVPDEPGDSPVVVSARL